MGSRAAAAWIAELNAVQALAASVPEADLENATASLRELRARLEAARAARASGSRKGGAGLLN